MKRTQQTPNLPENPSHTTELLVRTIEAQNTTKLREQESEVGSALWLFLSLLLFATVATALSVWLGLRDDKLPWATVAAACTLSPAALAAGVKWRNSKKFLKQLQEHSTVGS
ncbi:unnamed protein product [Sympodiomycopsis kandeliae]